MEKPSLQAVRQRLLTAFINEGNFGQVMKEITLNDFLSKQQIAKARKLYTQNPNGFAKECAASVIAPGIKKINAKLGQENDPLFLAYLCEYAFKEEK